jgi:excisionase family DNA binding protein
VAENRYDWLSTKAAAARVGILPRTLYAIIDRGDVPAYKIGRLLRLRRHEVDDFLERCRVKPGQLAHLREDGPHRAMSLRRTGG